MFVNHIASKRYGGAEKVLDGLIVGVSKTLPEPVLLSQKKCQSDDKQWDCEPVVRLESFNFGELGGSCKALSLVAMSLRIIKAFFLILHLIHKHRLTAVCANSLIAGAFCALPVRLMRRQFIYYEHNIASQRRNTLVGLALCPVTRFATEIVCVSDAVRQSLVDEGVKPQKLHVIHNCYDFEDLNRTARTNGLPKRHKRGVLRIGMVANFIPWKRHDRFIEIVEKISQHLGNIRIEAAIVGGCLPGNEEYFAQMQRIVDEYEGVADLAMLDFQDNVADHLSSFDVLINPADAEPFGLVFIEAMYLGCVVVGSRYGSSPEIIDDGKTGLIVDYDDINNVIDRLAALAKNVSLRKKMGIAASKDVRTRFSIDRQVARFIELLG